MTPEEAMRVDPTPTRASQHLVENAGKVMGAQAVCD